MTKTEEEKLLKKKMKFIEKVLSGGYDDTIPDRRVSQAEAESKIMDQLASSSIGKQNDAYDDLVGLSEEMKNKIREIANMNTMGNVKLGLGEAWYQGQGHDDDHFLCKHCGGKLMVNSMKKKLFKRKKRRNAAKGKPKPTKPKFMRKNKAKKTPGPKKGGAKSAKQSAWMSYCKAVGKTPKMAGKPWNEVMKKASQLKKEGVTIDQIKKV